MEWNVLGFWGLRYGSISIKTRQQELCQEWGFMTLVGKEWNMQHLDASKNMQKQNILPSKSQAIVQNKTNHVAFAVYI